jgi:glycosyltransferase involved in cell wall biosynthesis
MSDVLYIVVPAYNESENIKNLIDDWYPIVEAHDGGGKSRLVIVNDGSKDNTYEIIRKYAEEKPLLTGLTKPNGGHGPTLIYGYTYALDHQADYIFQTDSDGQTNPAEFEEFWQHRTEYDAQFGNRTVRGDGKDRAFVAKTLCRILKHYFKVSLPDSNAPFRLMTRAYVAKYLPKLRKDYNLPNVILSTFGVYYHDRVRFVPVSFKPRQGGTNSINIRKITRIGWDALADFRSLKADMAHC